MHICSYSRKCSNFDCYHKERHEHSIQKGCQYDYCNKYYNEKVCCIEVKLVS